MITRKMILSISAFALLILVLSIEKIKLSWEIRTLHNNYENFRVENENLKVNFKDYYFSNVVARSSKTMLDCNNSKLDIKLTGTEG